MKSSPMARDSSAPHRRLRTAGLGIVVLVVSLAAAAWLRHDAPPAEKSRLASVAAEDAADLPDDPPVVNPGYVGIESCAGCHAERVAEVRETNHARTFRRPEAGGMPAGFAAGRGRFQSQSPALRFEMTQTGDEFFQTAIRTTDSGEERNTSRIDFVLGAGGKADEVYLTWHGDRLYELPMSWLYTFDCWGCSHLNPHGSGDFGRDSTLRCMECHNTWFAHEPGTRNSYRHDSFLMGVTCENCHGPGREHVEFHTAQGQGVSAHKIVNPARLARERQIEVCTQCHGNSVRHKGPALSYRPGEPLEDYYRTLTGPAHTEDDHVANQIKYLRQSRCFEASAMTCVTCHNPHRTESRTVTGVEACRKCHSDADCREQSALPVDVRDDCAGCHMPRYIKVNVNFETADDNYVPPIQRTEHRIAVHPRARDEVLLAWHRRQPDSESQSEARRLSRALVDHWLAEADQCRRDYRLMGAIAALREAWRIEPAPWIPVKIREVVALKATRDRGLADADQLSAEHRYSEAVETLESMLRVKPDDAQARGKLGTALAALGRNDEAIEHWKLVADHDPDDPYGYAMLGWLAYLQNRLEDSVEAYRRADEVDPFQSRINYHWGLALSKMGRWNDAEERFRHVLAIDPRHVGGHEGLAQALRNLGQPADALPFAQRAVRLSDSQNANVLLTLAEVHADLRQASQAEDAAGRALEAARASDPKTLNQLRQRGDQALARARSKGH